MGAVLDEHAIPHTTCTPPQTPFNPSIHLPQQLAKRQRIWWAFIDEQRSMALRSRDPDDDKRMHSCGGLEGGTFLVATRAEGVRSLTDFFFCTAVKYRLGMQVMPSCSCQHKSTPTDGSAPKTCLATADRTGHHAVQCKVGGAPYAAHGQGCHILHAASIQAGYQSRQEQIIPELATTKCPAPQLDVEGWGLRSQTRLLIDFTLRHPLAARYEVRSATAAASGEKSTHYPPRQGLRVRTAAMEVYGRHGAGLTALLNDLADLARQRERSFGLAPTRWLKRWRAQLSSMAAHLVGRAVRSAPPT